MKILEIVAPLGGDFKEFSTVAKTIATVLSNDIERYTVLYDYDNCQVYIDMNTDLDALLVEFLHRNKVATKENSEALVGDWSKTWAELKRSK